MRSRLVLLFAALGALLHPAASALAAHYVVDLQGGGDFTTIQAAIDEQAIERRDSILVSPGVYAESLQVSPANPSCYVVGTGGAEITSVLTIRTDPLSAGGGEVHFDGLAVNHSLSVIGAALRRLAFSKCVFRGDVQFWDPSENSSPQLSDCDFYGRTRLQSLLGYVRGLRFHGAPLYVAHSWSGSFYMEDCTFAGPADTLVYMPWSSYSDGGSFKRCSFANGVNGIIYGEDCLGAFGIDRCRFLDLSGVAISHEAPGHGSTNSYTARARVTDSRFERCGTAVRWVIQQPNFNISGGGCFRDTILDCTGDGVVYGAAGSRQVEGCIVDGCAGDGIVAVQTSGSTNPYDSSRLVSFIVVTGSRLTNNRGDGLRIVDRDSISGAVRDEYWWRDWPGYAANWQPQTVDSCLFANNGGAGLRLLAPKWKVTGCVAIGNGGDGFDLGYFEGALLNQARSNTSAFNRGAGIRVTSGGPQGDTVTILRRNLAAMNGRDGFRVPQYSFGSFAFNDAWGNYLTQYVGAWASLDSNLTVDPRFCDLSAGVVGLGLQQGSPCGPSGVYGLIGARPEECPSTLTVEPPAPGALAFAVRPSIARGAADFVPPSTGAEGIVELFDLAGRVVWRAPLGPATGVVRWRGEGEGSRVRAGLYWARFTRGSERATQRLVWLE